MILLLLLPLPGARHPTVRVALGGPTSCLSRVREGAVAARARTLINNSQRALNHRGLRGLFKTAAPGGDVFILRTYCALSTETAVLCTYQQKPDTPRPLFRVAAELESDRWLSCATAAAARGAGSLISSF